MKYPGDTEVQARYNPDKVYIVGWEYSANGWDKSFSPREPTHKVVWARPVFQEIINRGE